MKTKNKTLAVVEIAIVLCSMLLVATLPAVAADQNPEMQKLSANTIKTAAELRDIGLDVFGNANDDKTIDMRDITYIKLVIFGKKPKTDLADANYDGKVSMLDVGQTKLIILNKEKELTFLDIFREPVTVYRPIKRIVQLGFEGLRITRALGARDMLMGIGNPSTKQTLKAFYPVISELPALGAGAADCDYEAILSLEPDIVVTNLEANFALEKKDEKELFKEKLPGITIVCINLREITPDILPRSVRTYGYILDKEEEAEEYVDWHMDQYEFIKARTDTVPWDDKPRVFFSWGSRIKKLPYSTKTSNDRCGQAIILAGARNVADEIPDAPNSFTVDTEWILEMDPDYFLFGGGPKYYGYEYEKDETSEHEELIQNVLNRPEFAELKAVKNKNVMIVSNGVMHGGTMVGSVYIAKILYPELFDDVDPDEIHQEYVDKFCYMDYNVKERGVFVYPPLEWWQQKET